MPCLLMRSNEDLERRDEDLVYNGFSGNDIYPPFGEEATSEATAALGRLRAATALQAESPVSPAFPGDRRPK